MSCKCFTPNSILQIDRKKTFVYNVNFRNIQLIHHAKDSDCCFFMIPIASPRLCLYGIGTGSTKSSDFKD